MGKGTRERGKRSREELLNKRQKRTLGWLKKRLDQTVDHKADTFVADMREARKAVPGATQEIPVVPVASAQPSSESGVDPDVNRKRRMRLTAMNRDALRRLAGDYDIKGRGRMNKEELITALEGVL